MSNQTSLTVTGFDIMIIHIFFRRFHSTQVVSCPLIWYEGMTPILFYALFNSTHFCFNEFLLIIICVFEV